MTTSLLKQWADAVKRRDGKCRHCGTVEDLHAHHIKPKATHPDLILDVENGITLCYRCHKAEHERNRPVRIRRDRRPHRETLERKIVQLQEENEALLRHNRRLKNEVAHLKKRMMAPVSEPKPQFVQDSCEWLLPILLAGPVRQ